MVSLPQGDWDPSEEGAACEQKIIICSSLSEQPNLMCFVQRRVKAPCFCMKNSFGDVRAGIFAVRIKRAAALR